MGSCVIYYSILNIKMDILWSHLDLHFIQILMLGFPGGDLDASFAQVAWATPFPRIGHVSCRFRVCYQYILDFFPLLPAELRYSYWSAVFMASMKNKIEAPFWQGHSPQVDFCVFICSFAEECQCFLSPEVLLAQVLGQLVARFLTKRRSASQERQCSFVFLHFFWWFEIL